MYYVTAEVQKNRERKIITYNLVIHMHILTVIIGQSDDRLSYGLCENPGVDTSIDMLEHLPTQEYFLFTTFQQLFLC